MEVVFVYWYEMRTAETVRADFDPLAELYHSVMITVMHSTASNIAIRKGEFRSVWHAAMHWLLGTCRRETNLRMRVMRSRRSSGSWMIRRIQRYNEDE